jgi:predicted dehydrogenase
MRPPKLDYLPRGPRFPRRHKLGLIGCGGIAQYHLTAAQSFGVEVVALADVNADAARTRAKEYFPQAAIYTDHRELLARDDITVVEIATHTAVRGPQIRDALRAGKHVLSQKPFTFDLAEGRKLAALAERKHLRLGVNQNGRWAPQFSALLTAVRAGLLGDIHTLDMVMEWDHTWTRGSKFAELHHLILSDFAIHWFDIAATVFAGRPVRSVFANSVKAPHQDMKPPMLSNAVINFGDGLATLGFSAYQSLAPHEYLCCVGSKGTLRGAGNLCNLTELDLTTKKGTVKLPLTGKWFPDGFRGTLGEFLRSIEENREASISARNNLRSLEICFAALASADTGRPVKPGRAKTGRL